MLELVDYLQILPFVLTVELEPPKGCDLSSVYKYAKALKGKVHAVNITDSPMANMRLSPIAVAHMVKQEAGIDAVFHLTCRDRNVIGLQAELLGAHALGVRSILVLSGDPPSRGDHPNARGIFEVDSVGLVKIANCLNKGYDWTGHALKGASNFHIGVAANPLADDMEKELERLAEKIENGAHFIQTQPIYEPEVLARFVERIRPHDLPIIAGVLPIKSRKMCQHILQNIPGIHIPAWLVAKIEKEDRQGGVDAARQLLKELPFVVQGAHIMPIGSASLVQEVLAPINTQQVAGI